MAGGRRCVCAERGGGGFQPGPGSPSANAGARADVEQRPPRAADFRFDRVGPGAGRQDVRGLPQRPRAQREPLAGILRPRHRRTARRHGGEDDPQAARGSDAAAGDAGGPTRPRSRAWPTCWRRRRMRGRASSRRGGGAFSVSTARSTRGSIHDLLALDVNAGDYLPLDAKSANFDNIADAQLLSPTLMQAYLTAAAEISRLAVGDPAATAREATYPVSRWTSQREHVEGAPYGTRGGRVGRRTRSLRTATTGSACPSITRPRARCTGTAARRCTRPRRPSRSRSPSTACASRCSTSTAG